LRAGRRAGVVALADPMRCPLCETENPDDVAECASCGKQLHDDAMLLDEVEPIEGLEETLRDPLESAAGPIEMLPELERTQLARGDLRIQVELVPGVERTQLEVDESVPSSWTVGQVELDRGREQDLEPRTEKPQDSGTCPWCGAAGTGAVCDSCGRRRSRYTEAKSEAASVRGGDTVLCPGCFARVAAGPRCEECGVPFAPREL
jgi:hypothetical protein